MKVSIALIEGYSFTNEPVELGIAGIAGAAARIEDLGFDLVLTPETAGHDPFFPLLIAAEHTERLGLTTGVAVAFPRSPMVVAQMAWDLQRFSKGRFTLGLGTQVKGHNERRYGTPWTAAPTPRMRDYLMCLRAIFATFQNPDAPTYHEGRHFKYTMAPPVFTAGPIEHPHIPVHLAAVNRHMARLGGELCDGVFAHPCCTARYVREVMLPFIEQGARKAGRNPSDVAVVGSPMIVTGRNAKELQAERQLLKQRVAFYGSTRSYHPVFELHGWKDLAMRLHGMSREGRWQEMTAMIPDEMADEFGTVAPADEIGDVLAERWGGLIDVMNLPTDFPLASEEDEARAADIIARLHEV